MPVVFFLRQFLADMIDLAGVGSVADESSAVKFILQNTLNSRVLPQEAVCDFRLVISELLSEELLLVIALRLDALGVEYFGDCLDTVTGEVQIKYPADDRGLFLDDDHLTGVLVFEIPHRRDQHDALFLLLLVSRTDFLGDVPAVHIVEDSLEADHQLVILVACVDVFRHRQHPHIVFPQVVNEECRLRFVSAEAGKVFDDDGINRLFLHLIIDFFNALTVEVHAADIVVKGFSDDGVTVVLRVFHQNIFLIGQRIQFLVLVTGQAVIEPRSHKNSPFLRRLFFGVLFDFFFSRQNFHGRGVIRKVIADHGFQKRIELFVVSGVHKAHAFDDRFFSLSAHKRSFLHRIG